MAKALSKLNIQALARAEPLLMKCFEAPIGFTFISRDL
jgi:hypothetical protein